MELSNLSISFRVAKLQLDNLKNMGKIERHLSTAEHNKAWTECIILGAYYTLDHNGKYSIPKTKHHHDANIVITGGTAGCHDDNLQCHQWWQSWHHDNSVSREFLILLFIQSYRTPGYITWAVYFTHKSSHFSRWRWHPDKEMMGPTTWSYIIHTQSLYHESVSTHLS